MKVQCTSETRATPRPPASTFQRGPGRTWPPRQRPREEAPCWAPLPRSSAHRAHMPRFPGTASGPAYSRPGPDHVSDTGQTTFRSTLGRASLHPEDDPQVDTQRDGASGHHWPEPPRALLTVSQAGLCRARGGRRAAFPVRIKQGEMAFLNKSPRCPFTKKDNQVHWLSHQLVEDFKESLLFLLTSLWEKGES